MYPLRFGGHVPLAAGVQVLEAHLLGRNVSGNHKATGDRIGELLVDAAVAGDSGLEKASVLVPVAGEKFVADYLKAKLEARRAKRVALGILARDVYEFYLPLNVRRHCRVRDAGERGECHCHASKQLFHDRSFQ